MVEDIKSGICFIFAFGRLFNKYKEFSMWVLLMVCMALAGFNYWSYTIAREQAAQLDKLAELVSEVGNMKNKAVLESLILGAKMELAQSFASKQNYEEVEHELYHKWIPEGWRQLISKQLICLLEPDWYLMYWTPDQKIQYCRAGNLPYIEYLINEVHYKEQNYVRFY